MKVLLLNSPRASAHLPPLGLLYIAAVLEKNDISVKVIDCPIEGIDFDGIPPLIQREKPTIVGVTSTTPTISFGLKTFKIVKDTDSSILTVVGGPHPTATPDDTIKNNQVDFVVRHEGEYTMLDLVKTIEIGGNLKDVLGLTWKNKGTVVHNPDRSFIKDLDELPYPARHFVPIDKYPSILIPLKLPESQIMSSRGCPFNCAFCSHAIYGKVVRQRDYKKVVDEIEYLSEKYSLKGIFYYDDTLNMHTKWLESLCDEIIARGLNDIGYKAQVRVNQPLVNKELLQKMKKAGFYLLAYGIESGSPQILERIHKKITLEEIERAVKLTNEVGIKSLGFFMLGNLGENKETIKETIDFAKKLPLTYAQFSIGIPYPGTEFYEEAKKNNWLKAESWDDFIEDKRATIVEMPGLERKYLEESFRRFNKDFYFRPKYVLNQIFSSVKSWDDFVLTFKGFSWVVKAAFKL